MPRRSAATIECDAIARDFYDDVLNPEGFVRGSRSLSRALSAQQMVCLVWDKLSDLITPVGATGQLSDMVALYESHFQYSDPAKRTFGDIAVGEWWIDSQRLDAEFMRSSSFYQDFFRRFEICSYMASPVYRDEQREVVLSCHRNIAQGAFSPADSRSIAALVPDLQRAVFLREKALELIRIENLSKGFLERLSFGVAIVDERFKLMLHNHRGERWLATFGSSARWTARQFGLPVSLSDMIRSACRAADPVLAQAYRLEAGSDRSQLVVLRLRADHPFVMDSQRPAALLIFHGPREAPTALAILLEDLFEFTPAEIRLAERVSSGGRFSAWAKHLGISQATARSQLQSIFRKAGINTQAQLVSLLSTLASAT